MKRIIILRMMLTLVLISLFVTIQIVSGSASHIQASTSTQAPISSENGNNVLAQAAYWAERREGISPEKLQNAYLRAAALPQSNALPPINPIHRQQGLIAPNAVSPSNVWQSLGPSPILNHIPYNYTAGRTTSIAVAPGGHIIYLGAAYGGVWKSINGGQNWLPTMDSSIASISIGALALDPDDPSSNTIYVGTGDPSIVGYPGLGLYKTTSNYSGIKGRAQGGM